MHRMITLFVPFAIAAVVTLSPATAQAQEYKLTIKDHKFTPEELKVPANTRVVITVVNEDATAEEFESNILKVEKVIAGKSRGTVRIGPLKPGRYPFVGEFHEATAKGVVIAE
ncbi:MAG: cupredoxin domain-containing protein [Hyphomicrobiales bacterium]